jgi:GNAT superfamily N-acetyltransferase
MDESIVRGWLNRPVYEPNLWVWIIDETTDQPAALGVAELDHQVPEASLEWIQVLPAYRGRGLGKAVVAELLRRASDEAEFTTVAGKINNPTRPDRLYQRCGFTGRDLWWLLTS